MTQLAEALERGRDALKRQSWHEAFDLLSPLAATDLMGPEDLEGLAEAAWWAGELSSCIEARERAYALYLQKGLKAQAALVALSLADDYGTKLSPSVATGWQMRAERLVEGAPESIAHGYIALIHRRAAVQRGDREEALKKAREAYEIGLRHRNPDLMARGIHAQGRVLLAMGRAAEGMALIDEATLAAVSGELSSYATGLIYCLTITCCRDTADYRRAADWTEVAKRWCERRAIAGFPGLCRVHRAEIMRLRGSWSEAEKEARKACHELQTFGWLDSVGEAYYEVGEIRMRMGDLATAEDAFRQAHELGYDPQPGLALLHLRKGQIDVAISMIRRPLTEPHLNPLKRARLLPAHVEAALAAGDRETAQAAAKELQSIAETYGTQALLAMAAHATGMVLLDEGSAAEATESLRRAWQLWQEVDAPYEAATVRALLGKSYHLQGNVEESNLEFQAALATFERLGAVPEAQKLTEQLGAGAKSAGGEGSREVRTFMFTDIVRSTDLIEAIGDEAWGTLRRWHDHTLRALFAQHDGEEVDHAGDGFFVAFGTASGALDCAVAIQRTLSEHRSAHGFAPQVRIGLHLAPATKRGRDYSGKAVHQAARLGAQAKGGEILASEDVLAAAKQRFTASASHPIRVKGIAKPVRVATVSWH
jgi:class 3 adenylate cyclase